MLLQALPIRSRLRLGRSITNGSTISTCPRLCVLLERVDGILDLCA
jgi:hypothetical protein